MRHGRVPPLPDDAGAWQLAQRAAARLVDRLDVIDIDPTLGGEDFGYLLEKVPGAMLFVGIGNQSAGTNVALHNPRFQLDERVLPLGAALHCEMATATLDELNGLVRGTSSRLGCSKVAAVGGGAEGPQCGEGTNLGMDED